MHFSDYFICVVYLGRHTVGKIVFHFLPFFASLFNIDAFWF